MVTMYSVYPWEIDRYYILGSRRSAGRCAKPTTNMKHTTTIT